jgi:hypothetical protein
MLHLKLLAINVVAGVAGFQTMSSFKPNIKSLSINVLVLIFTGFLSNASFTPHSLGEEGGWMVEDGVQGSKVRSPSTSAR